MLERRDGMSKRAVRAAIDIGYGYTKGISELSQKPVIFPSLVAPARINPLEGCGIYERVPEYRLEFTSSSLVFDKFVGSDAQDIAGSVKPAGNEKSAETHDALLLTALGVLLAGAPDGARVDLAVGLPLSYYRAQKDKLSDRLSRLAGKLRLQGFTERYISTASVSVFPQGLGAIVASEVSVPRDGQIGIVDIGTHTTDLLLFKTANQRIQPIFDACKSIPVGIEELYKTLDGEFTTRTGEILPVSKHYWVLQKTLQGELIPYKGEQFDFRGILEEAKKSVAETIINNMQTYWDININFAEVILLGGGGAPMFAETMSRAFPHIKVIREPVFANARGFLKLLEQRLRVVATPGTEENKQAAELG